MQDIQKYKFHPRILELRIIMIYRNLANEYGVNKATEFFKAICDITYVDWKRMNGIISNVFKIRRLEKTNKKRFRQEVVFMGELYGESRYFVATNYLNVTMETMYRKSQRLGTKHFLSDEWLHDLDANVQICGIPQYSLEAKRFMEAYQNLMETLGRVSTSKTKL